ncbi:MAG: FecR domain-containing protein [Agriterribacter sp.]
METQQLEELIKKYNAGLCTEAEKKWLEDWYQTFEWNKSKNIPATELQRLKNEAWTAILSQKNTAATNTLYKIDADKKMFRIRWWYYAAAVLIIVSLTTLLKTTTVKQTTPVVATVEKPVIKDIPAGTSKAILVLGDGSSVALDSAAVSQLKEGDGTVIDKQYGKLVYNHPANATSPVLYNTLRIPRGAEYQLVLPDGSKVWMNAASSLKFPTRFTGTERKVFLSGEAYFEVAKNAKKPFKVSTDEGIEVEVLGTHFNVKAYEDENDVKTTLTEGKVKIRKDENTVTLAPSQQGLWKKKAQNLTVKEVDAEKEIAWKNGIIEFNDDELPYIMRQLSRWYDVDISFEGAIPKGSYNGAIPRKATLSEVMQILKVAGVKYWLDNKKLIVTGG